MGISKRLVAFPGAPRSSVLPKKLRLWATIPQHYPLPSPDSAAGSLVHKACPLRTVALSRSPENPANLLVFMKMKFPWLILQIYMRLSVTLSPSREPLTPCEWLPSVPWRLLHHLAIHRPYRNKLQWEQSLEGWWES